MTTHPSTPRCPRPAPTDNPGCRKVDLGYRVLGPPLGPEPVGDRHEVGLEDRFQHQLQRRLNHPIRDGRGCRACAASPTRRAWGSCVPAPATAETYPSFKAVRRSSRNPGTPTHSSTSAAVRPSTPGVFAPVVARDPIERHQQRRRVVHEVEQVVEPAAGIGRRPTVKFGLHLRYPPMRPDTAVPAGAGIHRRIFRHYSLLPSRNRCRPSPCARAFPGSEYYGGSAPPRPDRSTVDPARPSCWPPAIGQDRDGSRVHCDSLDEGGAQLCPCGLATATPQHFTVASRADHPMTARKFPARSATGTGAHRSRPISARFEPVYLSRDLITPVPLVLLSITLAGPAPSGGAGTSRRCQGCSHPPRHLPDRAALSFTVPAATGPAAKVSHLHSNHQRLAAHAGSG